MNRGVTLALRAVLAMILAGTLALQVVLVPSLAADLRNVGPGVELIRTWLPWLLVAGLLAIQVITVCVWRLVTMARRGTVFSLAAFRWVDIVIGTLLAGALIAWATGLVMAPGETIPPGLVLMIGVLGLLALGVALLVVVMRALLAQAVARDTEATAMRSELDQVI